MSVIRIFDRHCKVAHAWPGDRVRAVERKNDASCRVWIDGPGWVDVPAPSEAVAEAIRRSQEMSGPTQYVDLGVD